MSKWLLIAAVPLLCGQQPSVLLVENAASSVAGEVVPQMLVAIKGLNLAASTVAASGYPLPRELGGTAVFFDDLAAPLLYVSRTQINAQVPNGISGASTTVSVRTAAGRSEGFPVLISRTTPIGIFTQDASGCGQAFTYNIHADRSVTLNTPQQSLDPGHDLGLMVFATGLGAAADRVDGTPWEFNSADDHHSEFFAQFGIADVSTFRQRLSVTYAGPAPGTAGIDQINALIPPTASPFPATPEGCKIPIWFGKFQDGASQYVNVSIHSGGGACVDSAPDALSTVTWRKTLTSSPAGISAFSGFDMQILRGPLISFPPSPVGSFGQDVITPQPAFCAASYPETLNAGAVTIAGPGLKPTPVAPMFQNGVLRYQATLDPSLSLGGTYTVSAAGGPDVAAFTMNAGLPAPIQITTDLRPGTKVQIPYRVDWTGGDSTSLVEVQVIYYPPGQPLAATPYFYASARADMGSVVILGPPGGFFGPRPQIPSGSQVEIAVTQEPQFRPSQTSNIPGLSKGGEQSWRYVFDFTGLTAP